MKESMKQLLLDALEEAELQLDDISNYGIARSSGGVYVMTLWKNGKTVKGSRRNVVIKIDTVMTHMFLAVETLEEMMSEHNKGSDFTTRVKKKKDDKDDDDAAPQFS